MCNSRFVGYSTKHELLQLRVELREYTKREELERVVDLWKGAEEKFTRCALHSDLESGLADLREVLETDLTVFAPKAETAAGIEALGTKLEESIGKNAEDAKEMMDEVGRKEEFLRAVEGNFCSYGSSSSNGCGEVVASGSSCVFGWRFCTLFWMARQE